MNIEEIKTIVERIETAMKDIARFEKLKLYIDDRTKVTGTVTVSIGNETFEAEPESVKDLLDAKIADYDIAADEIELKDKVK